MRAIIAGCRHGFVITCGCGSPAAFISSGFIRACASSTARHSVRATGDGDPVRGAARADVPAEVAVPVGAVPAEVGAVEAAAVAAESGRAP